MSRGDTGKAARPVSLSSFTTFRIGGVAREFYVPTSVEALRQLLGEVAARGRQPFFLGRGANVLFPDGEYPRPVICTRRLRGLQVRGNLIRADAGVPLGRLISTAMRHGLSGLEGLVGIPATIGGAVAMNAGGHGGSFGERVARLGLLPADGGPLVVREGGAVRWDYRQAQLEGFVVAWAEVALSPAPIAPLKARARRYLAAKSATQPLNTPSAGCVFRNPPGASAGRWIEELGLKGLQSGTAEVSQRHANFIVNSDGRARARDVVRLVEEVRARVRTTHGVSMDTEIVLA